MVCQAQNNQSLVQSPLVQSQQKQSALLPAIRGFQTSPVTRDIDSAAKFIGAGAATVGVAGSGIYPIIFSYTALETQPIT